MKNQVNVLLTSRVMEVTDRLLKLKAQWTRVEQEAGRIAAEFGRELKMMREFLPKGTWVQWLKDHVQFTARQAQRFIAIAVMRERHGDAFGLFVAIGVWSLSRSASMPEEWLARVGPNTVLADPRTGMAKAITEMSTREPSRSLSTLQTKPAVQNQGAKLRAKLGPILLEMRTKTKEEYEALRARILQRSDCA